MSDTNSQNGLTPPYASWTTFKNFLEELGEKGVPERIDRSVMKKKSGSVQSQLRTSMRFLGLIDGESRATDNRLERMVEALGTDEWADVLREILEDAYRPYLDDLPLETGTAKQLEEVFKEKSDVSGSSLRKAIRFFLSAMKETDVKISSHFSPPARPRRSRSSSKKRKKKSKDSKDQKDEGKKRGTEESSESKDHDDGADSVHRPLSTPEGFRTLTLPIPGRSEEAQLVIPEDLAPKEWSLISTFVENYVEMNQGEE